MAERKAGEFFAQQAGTGFWTVQEQTDVMLWGMRVSHTVCMMPGGSQDRGQKERAHQIARLLNNEREQQTVAQG